jgi:GT2 family glycosyltransferase
VELCLRARAHLWDVAVDPDAKIIHLGSASSSSEHAIIGEVKGYLYIWAKHFPAWQKPFLNFILRLGALLRIVIFSTISRDTRRVTIYTKLLRDVLR